MADERILDKIKKCMALSQSSEPHEAAAAMRQAQKLMEIHGITQLQISLADIGESRIKSKVSVSRIKDWELALITMVGKAFGCRLLWSKSNSYAEDVYGTFILIGLKHQVELAQYTCDVMQRKLIKARAGFTGKLSAHYDRQYKTKQADGFCYGWIDAVKRTVHEFALSPEHKQLIDQAITNRSTGQSKMRNSKIGAEGFHAGKAAGAGESINRPINDRQPTLRLGA